MNGWISAPVLSTWTVAHSFPGSFTGGRDADASAAYIDENSVSKPRLFDKIDFIGLVDKVDLL